MHRRVVVLDRVLMNHRLTNPLRHQKVPAAVAVLISPQIQAIRRAVKWVAREGAADAVGAGEWHPGNDGCHRATVEVGIAIVTPACLFNGHHQAAHTAPHTLKTGARSHGTLMEVSPRNRAL